MATDSSRPFSIGVEEELQIVDPSTFDLRPHILSMLKAAPELKLGEQIKPEMLQSMVEIVTEVCETAEDVRDQIYRLRRTVSDLANVSGLAVVAAGTHP